MIVMGSCLVWFVCLLWIFLQAHASQQTGGGGALLARRKRLREALVSYTTSRSKSPGLSLLNSAEQDKIRSAADAWLDNPPGVESGLGQRRQLLSSPFASKGPVDCAALLRSFKVASNDRVSFA